MMALHALPATYFFWLAVSWRESRDGQGLLRAESIDSSVHSPVLAEETQWKHWDVARPSMQGRTPCYASSILCIPPLNWPQEAVWFAQTLCACQNCHALSSHSAAWCYLFVSQACLPFLFCFTIKMFRLGEVDARHRQQGWAEIASELKARVFASMLTYILSSSVLSLAEHYRPAALGYSRQTASRLLHCSILCARSAHVNQETVACELIMINLAGSAVVP